MPDLVNDPKYEGIDLIRPEEEDQYSPEELKRRRDLWREWADKQRDAAAKLTENAWGQGMDADTALSKAGFADQKEQGKYIWTLFGNHGLFAEQGNVDPNLEYNWERGVKTWKKGTDNEGQSIPITRQEYESRRQAQDYQRQGLLGYGAHKNAEDFKSAVGYGHFTLDPASGKYYNVGAGDPNNPATWEWYNAPWQLGNGSGGGGRISMPRGALGGQYVAQPQGGGGGGDPNAGWLPYQGESYGGFQFSQPQAYYGGDNTGISGQMGGGYTGDPYAGTRAMTGMAPAGQASFGPTRQQRAVQEQDDASSPYQQLVPQGSTELQKRLASGGNTGISGGLRGF
jgi:hypothetical protein